MRHRQHLPSHVRAENLPHSGRKAHASEGGNGKNLLLPSNTVCIDTRYLGTVLCDYAFQLAEIFSE